METKMTAKLSVLFFMIVLTTPALAALGPGSSGGGKGVVCRNSDHTIRTAELLDLWEAREIYADTIVPSFGKLVDVVKAATDRLGTALPSDDASWEAVDNDGNIVESHKGPAAISRGIWSMTFPFLDSTPNPDFRRLHGVRLALTDDSLEPVTPLNCAIEQIVRYDDIMYGSGTILVNQDIVDHLDLTNQAALIIHEALYKYLRDLNSEGNSLRVRRTVGLLFSGAAFASLDVKNLPSEYYACESTEQDKNIRSKAYVFPITWDNSKPGKNILTFQVAQLKGMPMLANAPLTDLPSYGGGAYFKTMADLSNLKGAMNTLNVSGIVQPELRAFLKVVSAARGKMIMSVTAKPSPFFPEGVTAVPLTCHYHKK